MGEKLDKVIRLTTVVVPPGVREGEPVAGYVYHRTGTRFPGGMDTGMKDRLAVIAAVEHQVMGKDTGWGWITPNKGTLRKVDGRNAVTISIADDGSSIRWEHAKRSLLSGDWKRQWTDTTQISSIEDIKSVRRKVIDIFGGKQAAQDRIGVEGDALWRSRYPERYLNEADQAAHDLEQERISMESRADWERKFPGGRGSRGYD